MGCTYIAFLIDYSPIGGITHHLDIIKTQKIHKLQATKTNIGKSEICSKCQDNHQVCRGRSFLVN